MPLESLNVKPDTNAMLCIVQKTIFVKDESCLEVKASSDPASPPHLIAALLGGLLLLSLLPSQWNVQ